MPYRIGFGDQGDGDGVTAGRDTAQATFELALALQNLGENIDFIADAAGPIRFETIRRLAEQESRLGDSVFLEM